MITLIITTKHYLRPNDNGIGYYRALCHRTTTTICSFRGKTLNCTSGNRIRFGTNNLFSRIRAFFVFTNANSKINDKSKRHQWNGNEFVIYHDSTTIKQVSDLNIAVIVLSILLICANL